MKSQRLVIFDLDRTIVRFGTYTPFLLWHAWHYAPHRLLLAPVMLLAMAAYKLKAFSRSRLKEIMFTLMVGRRPVSHLEEASDAFAAMIVREKCYTDALEAIEHHKADGDILVLATASYEIYAAPIARALGFDHLVATALVVEGGTVLPRLDGDNCYGTAKRAMIEDLIKVQKLEGLETLFYTDDHSDIPTLDRVDAAVAVNPTRKLRRYADRHDRVTIAIWH